MTKTEVCANCRYWSIDSGYSAEAAIRKNFVCECHVTHADTAADEACRCNMFEAKKAAKPAKFYIRAAYFYNAGTFGAKEDGALLDYHAQRIEFDSREDAIEYLKDDMHCSEDYDDKGHACFSFAGRYVCEHGEYARPKYYVRKVREARR